MSSKIVSSLLGEVVYSEQDVYHFKQGLPGFSNLKKFILLTIEDSPFTVLHSVEEDKYFFLINPFSTFPNYEFTIPEYLMSELSIEEEEQVVCYSVIVLREPLHESTANMVAPIILNTHTRQGAQLVLENVSYSVRQPIFVHKEVVKPVSEQKR